MVSVDLSKVAVLHTLGPTGTNCEAAAHAWFNRQRNVGRVELHATLEQAVEHMPEDDTHALLGCVVYPDLHTIVFSNLGRLALADCFVFPTFNMLLARRPDVVHVRSVASHPAPRHLVPAGLEVLLVNSNAQAALDCANGIVDACITTLPAAQRHGLQIVSDHGPVPMGFTIHVRHRAQFSESTMTSVARGTAS